MGINVYAIPNTSVLEIKKKTKKNIIDILLFWMIVKGRIEDFF